MNEIGKNLLNHFKNQNSDQEKAYQESLVKEQILDSKQDRIERRKYAIWSYLIVSIWLFLIFLILIFSGFNLWGFNLESSVLIVLFSTSTFNVLGLAWIVSKYLFSQKK